MREPSERREGQREEARAAAAAGEKRKRAERQTEREIEVEEAHLEGVAVGEHREHRRDRPWRATGSGGGEREGAPEEDQHRE